MKLERSGFSSVKSISNTYRIKEDRTKSVDRSEKNWVTKFAGLKLKIDDFDIFANLGGKSVSDLTETTKMKLSCPACPKSFHLPQYAKFKLHRRLNFSN